MRSPTLKLNFLGCTSGSFVEVNQEEPVRIALSRAVGWPVTHQLTVPAGATITEDDGVLTILAPGEVAMSVSVDGEEFLSKLVALSEESKRRALAAFDLRRR
ncbi:hypothetical protein [Nocardioides kribbensis]|uniref:AbrB/MazE/SpoVT family DNA-binding domain-containing protein n=1 Tax=Nocardioides kribbensis TaxID=305517 RepID=A0ABV1NTI1_9ACTN